MKAGQHRPHSKHDLTCFDMRLREIHQVPKLRKTWTATFYRVTVQCQVQTAPIPKRSEVYLVNFLLLGKQSTVVWVQTIDERLELDLLLLVNYSSCTVCGIVRFLGKRDREHVEENVEGCVISF